MGLNAIQTTQNIEKSYIHYLKSMFFFRDTNLRKIAVEKLNVEPFIKGPYIEVTAPFETGDTIQTLIDQGILCEGFAKLEAYFRKDMALYKHQQQALEQIGVNKRNAVVATGTGSGKTECFMIPVINELIRQHENGELGSGVRALLLYPMNALANDQLKRLRKILKDYPEITFGRYTGETLETRKKAEEEFALLHKNEKPLLNELLSREEMRDNPPNILVTNYAMLEYLLLRPKDSKLFENGDTWRYIILDEAHTYFGAQGTEISLLLRRLRDRLIDGRTGQIQCIATSATLGSGKDDYDDVAKFASSLFSEVFTAEDMIEATRLDYTQIQSQSMYSYEAYRSLINTVKSLKREEEKLEELTNWQLQYTEDVFRHKTWQELLYSVLKQDNIIIQFREILSLGSKTIKYLAERIALPSEVEDRADFIMHMVDIAVMAKEGKDEAPLLPARYHTFVKSLEGAFVSFADIPRVYLKRKKIDKVGNKSYKVFELSNCKKCGQEYLMGYVTDDYRLEQVEGYLNPETMEPINKRYFMIDDGDKVGDYDEDEVVDGLEGMSYDKESYDLCVVCGRLHSRTKVKKEQCCDRPQMINVCEVVPHNSKRKTNICGRCSGVSEDIIKRFITADDITTEILARELYQNIPPEKIKLNNEVEEDEWCSEVIEEKILCDESKRKLLIFSDSRSEAAYFSTFMDYRYTHYLWRKIGIQALEELRNKEVSIDTWVRRMSNIAQVHGICGKEEALTDIRARAYLYAMKETLALEDMGLQGTGYLGFYLPKPVEFGVPRYICQTFGLDVDGVWELFAQMLDSCRGLGALAFPEDVTPEDDEFIPRNFQVYLKFESQKEETHVIGWSPRNNASNKRHDYLKKLLLKQGKEEKEAKQLAYKLLKDFENVFRALLKADFLIENTLKYKGGVGYTLNYRKFRIIQPSQGQGLYRCTKCGEVTAYNVNGVCPAFRCNGHLSEYKGEETRFSYYRDLYQSIKLIPLKIEEHTAQLSKQRASELQNKFEQGKVNILSCSTTFEMGVDVGQLEAVFMRNVPPETANYIQRAGRAGRRTESTAYALTFAKRRSHDMNYFTSPEEIISGKIKPPYIEENNIKIVRRHVHSVIFAWLFRQYPEYFENTQKLIRMETPNESIDEKLKKLLADRPQAILDSLKNVVPPTLYQELKLETWGWEEELLGEDANLTTAKRRYTDTINQLSEIIHERSQKQQKIDSYVMMKNTYEKKTTLDFLARNSIIPRYGFPIDSVELDIKYHGHEARQVELNRDLKQAISEFAPGNEVIAGGKVWTSYRINKDPQKNWPTFYYAHCEVCRRTYKYHSDLTQTREELFEHTQANKLCRCGEKLKYMKYIQPLFGFSTSHEKPKKPTGRRSIVNSSTGVYFDNYEGERPASQATEVNGHIVTYRYSSKGIMFLVNRGGKDGLKICSYCGYATNKPEEKGHYNLSGRICQNKKLHRSALGHEFTTDVLELELPWIGTKGSANKLPYSLLYAIIEGATRALGISKRELNGCLNYTQDEWPSFILYDEIPGGVGHVKHIAKYLEKVLYHALLSVLGKCGCDADTSCYACIRNYSNQIHHERLERGLAQIYLDKLLN